MVRGGAAGAETAKSQGPGTVGGVEAAIMPRLDMTTDEMTILRWMKGEGEFVEEGEPLLEVMTEKIAIEIDAPFSGYVRNVRYGVDDVVAVGEVIAYIAESLDGPLPEAGNGPEEKVLQDAVGGSKGAAGRSSAQARPDTEPDALVARGPTPVRAAPVVRRIAADLGVDLRQVIGTGPGGRVLAEDVRTFAEASGGSRTEDVAHGIGVVAGPSWGGGAVEEVRLSPTRRTIARRMGLSWRTAPHVTLTMDVDMAEAAAFRVRLKEAWTAEGDGKSGSLTWNSFIAWVAVQALVRHPLLNATLDGDVLRRFEDIHLGVGVDTPSGLVVPVVRSAQSLGPAQLATALTEAAAKAMAGTLQPADVADGTFTVTNLGGFGIGAFTPVLNPPQVAILGVGAVREQVIPVDGRPAVRPVCTFSLSFDHRAVDGADGARYLQTLHALLLNPHRLVL